MALKVEILACKLVIIWSSLTITLAKCISKGRKRIFRLEAPVWGLTSHQQVDARAVIILRWQWRGRAVLTEAEAEVEVRTIVTSMVKLLSDKRIARKLECIKIRCRHFSIGRISFQLKRPRTTSKVIIRMQRQSIMITQLTCEVTPYATHTGADNQISLIWDVHLKNRNSQAESH